MFLDNFTSYISHEKRHSPHTVQAYREDISQFSSFISSGIPPITLLQADNTTIRSWVVALHQAQIGNKSIRRKLSSLRSFYKFLLREGTISHNPTEDILSPKVPKKLPEILPSARLNEYLGQLSFSSFEEARKVMVLELLYGTGMRLSELIQLKDSDIDSNQSSIKVLGKGNKERIIPIHNDLEDGLRKYIKIRDDFFGNTREKYLLLTDKGKRCYPMLIQRICASSLSKITTQKKRSPHVLRHSFATDLLNEGAELNAIKDLLGHSSLAATQVYTHNSIERLKSIYKIAHPRALKKGG